MLLFLTYYAQYYPHKETCASFCNKLWLDYYITKAFIKNVLNLSYYVSIMPNAFRDLLCSKLCWHNRPGLIIILSVYTLQALIKKLTNSSSLLDVKYGCGPDFDPCITLSASLSFNVVLGMLQSSAALLTPISPFSWFPML